jgi:hypothetical protein
MVRRASQEVTPDLLRNRQFLLVVSLGKCPLAFLSGTISGGE